MGLAQTGTGKTAAFAVPALSRLAELHDLNGPSRKTQALVLAPTRELALQVAEAFTSYAKHIDDFTVLPVYGGSAYGPQLAGLRRGAQVVVGTPGRVIDHIAKGSLDLSELQYLVLDEADEMLRMGFAEDVEQIFQQTPAGRQVALFSATMPSQIRRLSKQYLNNPAEVQVKSKTTTGANTRQRYLQVMGPHKLDALTRILEVEEFEGVIAFVRTKMATEDLADKLRSRGFQAAAINGDIPQQQRERTVEALRDGKIDILVATDVAARGLDVERVSHVVNYDIPHDTESYVHRIGRTGRAGRSGDAILFMTPREKYLLRSIEKATRQPVEQMHLPTAETVNTLRLGKFAEKITETLASEDVAAFRDLIASYEEEHNVPASEIAAALAVMAQGGQPLLVKELPAAPEFQKRERSKDGFGSRGPTRTLTEGNATYRIAVGRRQRVMPGSIVGAIANEGGISSAQIGGIDIRADHSLVELPADLSADQLKALSRTRIGGELIHLELDNGRKPSGDRGSYQGDRGGDRGGYSAAATVAATSRATAASSANSARATASGPPLTVADAPSATATSAASAPTRPASRAPKAASSPATSGNHQLLSTDSPENGPAQQPARSCLSSLGHIGAVRRCRRPGQPDGLQAARDPGFPLFSARSGVVPAADLLGGRIFR